MADLSELRQAIYDKLLANATCSDLLTKTTGNLSFALVYGEAPPDMKMPYACYYIIGTDDMLCFNSGQDWTSAWVQFSIFDVSDLSTVEQVRDGIKTALNRESLTFPTLTSMSCYRIAGTGPMRLDDCWQLTEDYRIEFD